MQVKNSFKLGEALKKEKVPKKKKAPAKKEAGEKKASGEPGLGTSAFHQQGCRCLIQPCSDGRPRPSHSRAAALDLERRA